VEVYNRKKIFNLNRNFIDILFLMKFNKNVILLRDWLKSRFEGRKKGGKDRGKDRIPNKTE